MTVETNRPLWQLLLKARSGGDDVKLNCQDCFLILEFLADIHHNLGTDIKFLRELASKNLSCCPDCRQFYLKRLEELQQMQ